VTWTSISRFLVANTVFFGCKPGCLHLPFLNAFCIINVRENYATLKTNSRNLSREDESVKTKCKKYLIFVWHLFHKVYVEHEPIVRDFPIAKCKVGLWKRDFHETSFKTDAFGAWNDISSRIFMRKQWHEIVKRKRSCSTLVSSAHVVSDVLRSSRFASTFLISQHKRIVPFLSGPLNIVLGFSEIFDFLRSAQLCWGRLGFVCFFFLAFCVSDFFIFFLNSPQVCAVLWMSVPWNFM
jgi:hypothetical protein